VTTSTSTTTSSLPDHYVCYNSFDRQQNPPVVTITDQFQSADFRPKRCRPKAFCAPAGKNGAPIFDPDTHLKRYKIRRVTSGKPTLPSAVDVTNQFGTIRVQPLKATGLLVPTSKSLVAPPPPPDPARPGHQHYLCYKIRVVGAPFAPVTVTAEDQFGTRQLTLRKPTTLCNPATKNGSVVQDPTHHLLCYDVRGVTDPGQVFLNNQFGAHTANLNREGAFCVPSQKVECGVDIPLPDKLPKQDSCVAGSDPNTNPDCNNWKPEGNLYKDGELLIAGETNLPFCTGAGAPSACCTGPGRGTCSNAECTGAGAPYPCCTAKLRGSCLPTGQFYSWKSADNKVTCVYLYRLPRGTPPANGVLCFTDSCDVCALDYPPVFNPPANPTPTPAWSDLVPLSSGAIDKCSHCHSPGIILPQDSYFGAISPLTAAINRSCARLGGPRWIGAPATDLTGNKTFQRAGTPGALAIYGKVAAKPDCDSCHTQGFVGGPTGMNSFCGEAAGAFLSINVICTGAGAPLPCCTAAGRGTCNGSSYCTGAGVPFPCCTGAGAGNCTGKNSVCSGATNPFPCCTGVGTGTCDGSMVGNEFTKTCEAGCMNAGASCTGAGDCMGCLNPNGCSVSAKTNCENFATAMGCTPADFNCP
jgi:hypothetical protein